MNKSELFLIVVDQARGMGVQVRVFNAGTSREIDAAFANLVRERSDAVFVGGDAFLSSRRVQVATLAARYLAAVR